MSFFFFKGGGKNLFPDCYFNFKEMVMPIAHDGDLFSFSNLTGEFIILKNTLILIWYSIIKIM